MKTKEEVEETKYDFQNKLTEAEDDLSDSIDSGDDISIVREKRMRVVRIKDRIEVLNWVLY